MTKNRLNRKKNRISFSTDPNLKRWLSNYAKGRGVRSDVVLTTLLQHLRDLADDTPLTLASIRIALKEADIDELDIPQI